MIESGHLVRTVMDAYKTETFWTHLHKNGQNKRWQSLSHLDFLWVKLQRRGIQCFECTLLDPPYYQFQVCETLISFPFLH